MDRKSKLVIVGLIVVALLFLIGLGTGLVPKKDQNMDEEAYMNKKGGWERSMGRLLAPFGPKLHVDSLLSSSVCRHTGRTILLTEDSPSCVIVIPRCSETPHCDDERYRKATLRVKQKGVKVLIPVFEKKGSTATRGPVMQLQTAQMAKLQLKNQLKVQPKGPTLELKVMYQPRDGDKKKVKKWTPQNPVRLAVLRAGGTLELNCSHCAAGRTIRIDFE